MRIFALFTIYNIVFFSSYAQNLPTQMLKGVVKNAATLNAVENAAVYLKGTQHEYYTTASAEGFFTFENIPTGMYTLECYRVGFEPKRIMEIALIAGKQKYIEVFLEETSQKVEEVEVVAKRAYNDESALLSERTFTMEQTQRYAAGFFDPARLATSYAGVIASQDLGNDLVIRGNSPAGVKWWIEGVEVLNPNHLSNGSTPNERVSASGGGVNILSGQMMNDSKLYTGAYHAGLGNATAGIFDIKLRKGNTEKREYTLQASFIGLDAAAEGPIKKGGKSSYLINYRYSTVGLLALGGIDFGGQTFGFQDLAATLHFPTKKWGEFTLFAFGGLSENNFNANRDSTTWVSSADKTDIRFRSNMGAVGANHSARLNKTMAWHTSAAYSATFSANQYQDIQQNLFTKNERYNQTLLSINSYVSARLNPSNTLKSGIIFQNRAFYYPNNSPLVQPLLSPEVTALGFMQSAYGSYSSLQPYVSESWHISPQWLLQTGIHSQYLLLNQRFSLDPRVKLTWKPQSSHTFMVSGAKISQTLPIPSYFFTNTLGLLPGYNANKLDFMQSLQAVAGYIWKISAFTQLRTEAYYQYIYRVPVSFTDSGSYSLINYLEGVPLTPLVQQGTAANKGVEVSLEQSLHKGWFYTANTTLYNSEYKTIDGRTFNTRFNGRFATHLTLGKEWDWKGTKNKNRTVNINIRTFYSGGFRETPLLPNGALDFTQAYSVQLPDYFRTDFRIAVRKQRQGYTRTLALDVQNLTNRKNIAIRYYDSFSGEIYTKYQLDLIPVLSYRVEI